MSSCQDRRPAGRAPAPTATMSAIRSPRQQDTDPIELMVAAQRAPKPAASEALRIPARAGPAQRRAVA